MKRQCRDEKHEGDNPLPGSAFYDTNPSYCRACIVRRVRETRERQENGEVLINGYLKRHLKRRESEAEIGESLMREEQGQNGQAGEMSFADIKHNSLNPEPVFRDLTNCFQRPQTKVSHWRTA